MAVLTPTAVFADADESIHLSSAEVVLHSGRADVLSHASALEDLAERSGQPGAMHGLAYLLDQEYAARKVPHLVLFFSPDQHDSRRLLGSVLLFEYRIGTWKTGLISTGDSFGVRTVIGPEVLRPSLAAAACSVLLRRGAKIVLVSFKQRPQALIAYEEMPRTEGLWSVQARVVRDQLRLAASYDATLARLGKRTRTHLRYYRRRLEEALPCEFVADAAGMINGDNARTLIGLNRSSRYPLPQAAFDLQYLSTAGLPGGFVSGLRSKAGAWLSLAGGWRQGDTTWVQWQTNAAGFEGYSLSTVLRSFLLEAELVRGTKRLAFHGGTSHSMAHAFEEETVVDLMARRAGLFSVLLVRAVSRFYGTLPLLHSRGNFLADALRSRRLRWCSGATLAEAFGREATVLGDTHPTVDPS